MRKIQLAFLINVGSLFKLPIKMTFSALYPSFDSEDVFNDDPLHIDDSFVDNRNIFSSLLSAYYIVFNNSYWIIYKYSM